ncbi:hypothetical protein [Methanoculleus sp. MH98A]|uniref:hypothetical protein n=1 Tax=Methanoculleus sp. MH98A TaxID=1495314 RepID=UPI0012DDC72D|nr:hypothetical protein [Methanoculleus sp. MH98A]
MLNFSERLHRTTSGISGGTVRCRTGSLLPGDDPEDLRARGCLTTTIHVDARDHGEHLPGFSPPLRG